jgi:hypothetical protein
MTKQNDKVPNKNASSGKLGQDEKKEIGSLEFDQTIISKFSPHIKGEMEALLKHEEKIKQLLSKPDQQILFVQNPAQFFKAAKIELSPILKRKVAAFDFKKTIESNQFIMPNGQAIQPNIKINIKNK